MVVEMAGEGKMKGIRQAEWIRTEMEIGGAQAAWAEVLELGKGPGVVNLGQGAPDFPGSQVARKAACDVIMNQPLLNQYSPANGLPSLKAALSRFYQRQYGVTYNPNTEVLVTASAAEALFAAVNAFCGPGDEVVVFEPCFPWYFPWVRMAGATVVTVALQPPDFAVQEDALRAAIGPRTKAVVFNTPHNPTGHVAIANELEAVAAVCRERNLLAIVDDIYETTIFGDAKHRRLADVEGMWERTVTVSGASKMFSLTGWRVGWAVGPPALIAAVALPHNYASYCAPTPFQEAVAVALDAWDFGNAVPMLNDNTQRLSKALTAMGLTVAPSQGGYFLVADVTSTGMDDLEFCQWLAKTKKVAAVPMRCFYADANKPCNLVRFAICKTSKTINKAIDHLESEGPAP